MQAQRTPQIEERPPRWGNLVPRVLRTRRLVTVFLIVSAAAWGIVVDSGSIPLLRPSGNSTILQATTAAPFALLGILLGPLAGALPGLLRDGTLYLVFWIFHPVILAHPHFVHAHPIVLRMHPGSLRWGARAVVDIAEDVVLGLVPGLVGLRTRRLLPLVATTIATAWLSLPLLVTADTLIAGHVAQLWTALTTVVGDWDEPVDPGLLVYAALTGSLIALTLARWSTRPRRSLLLGLGLAALGLTLIALGAHA